MLKIKAYDGMSVGDIEKELNGVYNSPGGLQKIAAMGLQPLKETVPYESRARQIFAEYTLAAGEEAVFDGDVRVPAVALSIEGLPYIVEAKSNRLRIDTSPISASALVKWSESNYRKFDMIDWVQVRSKSALLEQEDTRALAVLEASSELFNTKIESSGKLLIDKIAEAAATVLDSANAAAVRIVMGAKRSADLAVLQATTGNATANIFVPEYQQEVLDKGVQGKLLNMEVLTLSKRQDGTTIIDPDTIYVVGPAELVGVVAVRSELVAHSMQDVRQNADIINYWEDVGFLCKYSKAVIKIKITA